MIEQGRGRSASRTAFAVAVKARRNLPTTCRSTRPICSETSPTASPCRERNLQRSCSGGAWVATTGALLVILGHIAFYCVMRVVGCIRDVAWSWMWRLTVITVISSAAELGLIALAFNWLGARRGLAFSLLLVCSALGAVLRLYHGCAIPLVPACIDASLLGGRPTEQIVGGIVALSWLGFAVFLIARRRARKSAKEDAGSAAVA